MEMRYIWMPLQQVEHTPGLGERAPAEGLAVREVFLRNLLLCSANLYYYFSPYSSFSLMPAMLVLWGKPRKEAQPQVCVLNTAFP